MKHGLLVLSLGLLMALGPGVAVAKESKAKKESKQEGAKEEKKEPYSAATFSGLELRGIGPALTSGRVVEFAVDPANPKTYYVAAASGGVWKTTNAGTTWAPIFDGQGSYSIGTVALDPKNPNAVWVGTGENNSQRSVGYGDGLYRSLDGGKSWDNLGLKESEHIARIVFDPRDSNVVWVAAQGPLWGPGGDRGLYQTTDGGKSWSRVLEISPDTGVSDVVLDPRAPDTVYAAAYQRRRHVWTLIDGGPESAVHKSTDGGKTWRKIMKGMPSGDVGRIGLAISPMQPDVLYAIVEAPGEEGGVFRSADRGESWSKKGDHVSSSPQYYQELVADPVVFDRIYSLDFLVMVSDDGGANFRPAGEDFKHVDNHALWIDPEDNAHLLVGCDGGVYETFDGAATWNFKANLPITQFYRVDVDDALPFYNIFGGTQDNFSLHGPSRTTSANGITNESWRVTQGGDGFFSRAEPGNPDIVYAEAQYGGIARFDRKSGEGLDIQPQPFAPGEALRWNWDSPLLISPHAPTRLYFAANKLFRSDDRGATWKAVSPDLTRQIDRNKLEVMGKVWSIDAVAKNASTSLYGNITALAESPRVEGLLYVGTDDGLIQVSEDGGGSWRKVESFPGVPANTFVARLEASRHDAGTVYAAFDNHKMADFKPYLLKSTDRGRSWTSVTGDLPARGSSYTVVEDHVDPKLLFAGTEFGVFFSRDGGSKWIQLKGGLPTIAVKELAIQTRENDLVLATFGRGFYVLDDYSPLRTASAEALERDAVLFPVKQAWAYMEEARIGLPKQGFLGHSYYVAPNPPFGATFTYYLKESAKTRAEKRKEAEEKIRADGGKVPYPSWDDLRAEEREEAPSVVVTVTDEEGNVVRRLSGPAKQGIHRLSWDLRFPAANPTDLKPRDPGIFGFRPQGPMAVPGTYKVALERRVDGKLEAIGEPQTFEVVPLGTAALPAADREALLAFQRKTARLQGAALGAGNALEEARERVQHLKQAIVDTPGAALALRDEAVGLEHRLEELDRELNGDGVLAGRNESVPPSILERIFGVVFGHWGTTSAPTQTHRDAYEAAAKAFEPVLARLRTLVEKDLAALEAKLEAAGGPWTPGRVPTWKRE